MLTFFNEIAISKNEKTKICFSTGMVQLYDTQNNETLETY